MLPAAFDTRQIWADPYRVVGTPTTMILDSEHRILWRHFGYLPGDEKRTRDLVVELLGAAAPGTTTER